MFELKNSTPNTCLILGASGTGKTETLLARVKDLLSSGILGSDIRVFCATPSAARVFKSRLFETVGEGSCSVVINTPRALALDILGGEDAQKFTGRKAKLLLDFEISFLIEDMKVSGIRPKRLSEMLKFFYRSWTELADDDPSWLLNGEEKDVHTLLKENLSFTQRILEPELVNLTVNYLNSQSNALKQHQTLHVFADDYQNLSRASQVFVNMIAKESLCVAADDFACLEVFDSFPYAEGINEFTKINPDSEKIILESNYLPFAVDQATKRILDNEGISVSNDSVSNKDKGYGSIITQKFSSITTELDGVTKLLKEKLDKGIIATNIFVVAFSKVWKKQLLSALKKQDILVDVLPDSQVLRGDIRDFNRCSVPRIFTALKLVADPQDTIAWRCWCGFGDHLTNSTAMTAFRDNAIAQRTTLVDMLASPDAETLTLGSKKVLGAFHAGNLLIEKAKDLTGLGLLQALTARIASGSEDASYEAIQQLCGNVAEGDTAHDLVCRIEKNLLFPEFTFSKNAVKVGTPEQLCGLSSEMLVLSGFVNGFFPERDYFDATKMTIDKQAKIHRNNIRLLCATLGKTQKDIVISYFNRADLETTEMLKLDFERIRMEGGKRVCVIAPSLFLSSITE